MIKKVLIDLSGTIHVENSVIPDAARSLKRLRSANLDIKFVTNTTKESRRLLYNRLTQLGFELDIDEICSSLLAARNLIEREKLNPMMLVDERALEDFSDLPVSNEKNSVVIGLAPEHFHYHKLNEAFRLIKNGAKLIAINEGRYHQTECGLSLGPGLFVKGLEYATDSKATVVGKPSKDFFLFALGEILPCEAIMIGDDARDDVGGAQAVGIRGILVKTGKYKSGDEMLLSSPPLATVESFPQAVDLILELVAGVPQA